MLILIVPCPKMGDHTIGGEDREKVKMGKIIVNIDVRLLQVLECLLAIPSEYSYSRGQLA